MKTLGVLAAFLALSTAASGPLAAQTPEVDAALDKAGDYVTEYQRRFAGVVAEETYRQDVRGRAGTDPRGFAVEAPSQRRDLKSDLLLVRAPAGDWWMQFRDVFEVDGKPVRALEPAMGLFVPREMREKDALKDGSTIEGKASYAKFHRFQVTVDEKMVATLDAVLARAGAYVVDFQRRLSGIVSEERYLQEVVLSPMGRFSTKGPTHRELKSDLLLVKPVGADRWIQFRDVFEVDGKPIRDRNERLVKLFLEPSASTKKQVERIVDESTRYNIGNMERTVNVPMLALAILDPENQSRFKFKDPDGDARRDAVWVIQFQEVERETMIRTSNGRDLPAHGRFWIEPGTGRVLRSELIAEDVLIRGVIDVKYEPEPDIGLLVPVQMRGHYEIRRDGSRVVDTATYGRFRQFQVKVDEKLSPVVKQ